MQKGIYSMSPDFFEAEREKMIGQTDRATQYFKDILAFEMDPELLLKKLYDENLQIIDIRDFEDFVEYHIPGATSIPLLHLREKLNELIKEKIYVVYGYDYTTKNDVKAALILSENKFKVTILSGGFKAWSQRSFPINSMITV